jgi:hypothetical protein
MEQTQLPQYLKQVSVSSIKHKHRGRADRTWQEVRSCVALATRTVMPLHVQGALQRGREGLAAAYSQDCSEMRQLWFSHGTGC